MSFAILFAFWCTQATPVPRPKVICQHFRAIIRGWAKAWSGMWQVLIRWNRMAIVAVGTSCTHRSIKLVLLSALGQLLSARNCVTLTCVRVCVCVAQLIYAKGYPNPNPSTGLLLMMIEIMAIQANRLNLLDSASPAAFCHMPCCYCCQVATKSSKQKPCSFVCPFLCTPCYHPHCQQILLGQKLLKYLIRIHVRQSSIWAALSAQLRWRYAAGSGRGAAAAGGAAGRASRRGQQEELCRLRELYFPNRLMNLQRLCLPSLHCLHTVPSMIINNLFDTLPKRRLRIIYAMPSSRYIVEHLLERQSELKPARIVNRCVRRGARAAGSNCSRALQLRF